MIINPEMTVEELGAKIAELKEQERRAKQVLTDIGNDIRQMQLRLVELLHGIRIGTLVRKPSGIFRVSDIIPNYSTTWQTSKPWVKGHMLLKNYTFDNRETQLFDDWILVPKEEVINEEEEIKK